MQRSVLHLHMFWRSVTGELVKWGRDCAIVGATSEMIVVTGCDHLHFSCQIISTCFLEASQTILV